MNSQEQISFSVGNNPEARSGQADSRTLMRGSVMLPRKTFNRQHSFKCRVQSRRMTQCYLLPPWPCLSVQTGPQLTRKGLGQEKQTQEDRLLRGLVKSKRCEMGR